MSRDYTADGTCTRVPRFGLIGSAVVVLNEDDLIAVGQRHARPQKQRDERERGGADGNRERERAAADERQHRVPEQHPEGEFGRTATLRLLRSSQRLRPASTRDLNPPYAMRFTSNGMSVGMPLLIISFMTRALTWLRCPFDR